MPIRTNAIAITAVDVAAHDEVRHMTDDVHWVDKSEAARELEVSLSTLYRMIRKGELEVAREGRRVYVKMPGPRYPSDHELLRQAMTKSERLERTVGELAEEADQLEQERDQARAETETAVGEYRKLEGELLREQSAHQRTKRLARILGITAAGLLALLAIVILVAWWLLT